MLILKRLYVYIYVYIYVRCTNARLMFRPVTFWLWFIGDVVGDSLSECDSELILPSAGFSLLCSPAIFHCITIHSFFSCLLLKRQR